MRAWLEQPHGRRHKAPPQPCVLTTIKFVDGATPRSIKGAQIIEVGGGNNSLCKRVVEWPKQNMGQQYFNGAEVESGTDDGQVPS